MLQYFPARKSLCLRQLARPVRLKTPAEDREQFKEGIRSGSVIQNVSVPDSTETLLIHAGKQVKTNK